MASITLENLNKTYPNGFVSVKKSFFAYRRRRVCYLFRTKRLRKIHHTSHDRWYGGYYIR